MIAATSKDDKGGAAAKDTPAPSGDATKGGLQKLKDPNQAHEALEMPKNTTQP